MKSIFIFVINFPVYIFRIVQLILRAIFKMSFPKRYYIAKYKGWKMYQLCFDSFLGVFYPVFCSKSFQEKFERNPRVKAYTSTNGEIAWLPGFSHYGIDFLF